MPTLRFCPTGRAVFVARRARLLGAIVRAGLPIGRACEGRLICGACRVRVRSGTLSPSTPEEEATLRRVGAGKEERLACAARLLGDAEIWCAAWGPWP
jgi:ferredoxin